MNAAMSSNGDQGFNYRQRNRESKAPTPASHARRANNQARRRAKTVTQFNGIHRRRHKRVSW